MVYYFGGDEAAISGIAKLSYFGQRIELPESVGNIARRKVALFTEEEWKSIGFTADELKIYSTIGRHGGAPKEFLAKRDKAWKMYADVQKSFNQPAENEPPFEPTGESVETQPAQ